MFDVKLAVFKMKLLGYWSKEGVPNPHDSYHELTLLYIDRTALSGKCIRDDGIMCTICAAGDYEVIANDDGDETELEEDAGDAAAEQEHEEADGQNSKRQRH